MNNTDWDLLKEITDCDLIQDAADIDTLQELGERNECQNQNITISLDDGIHINVLDEYQPHYNTYTISLPALANRIDRLENQVDTLKSHLDNMFAEYCNLRNIVIGMEADRFAG